MGTALPYPGSSLIGGTSRDECCSNVLVLQVLEHVGRLLDVLEHLVPLVQLAAQRRVEAECELQLQAGRWAVYLSPFLVGLHVSSWC